MMERKINRITITNPGPLGELKVEVACGGPQPSALDKIRDAYAEAGREQDAERVKLAASLQDYPKLPVWEALSPQVREAIIHVYHAGAREALSRVEGGRYR